MLKHRIISGSLAGGLAVLAFTCLPVYVGVVALLVLSTLAQREFYAIMHAAGFPVFRVLGTILGTLLVLISFLSEQMNWAGSVRWAPVITYVCIIAVFCRQLWQEKNDKPIETVACTLLGVLYVPFLLNFFVRLCFTWREGGLSDPVGLTGGLLGVYLVAVVKFTDIGAFFTGRRFGKHKMFPRISPAKTWEGFAGGVAAAVLVSVGFFMATRGAFGTIPFRLHDALILGVLLALVGVVGDLFESMLKRASGIKDSGDSIPGMGGLLDVLDSLLFSVPLMYGYVILFLI